MGPLIISPAQLSGQLLRSLEAPRSLSAGTYVARSEIFRCIRVYVFRHRYVTMFPRTLNFGYLIAVRRSPFVLKQFVVPRYQYRDRKTKQTLRANYVLLFPVKARHVYWNYEDYFRNRSILRLPRKTYTSNQLERSYDEEKKYFLSGP